MPALMAVGEILVEMMAAQPGQSFEETGTFLGPYASGAPAICISQAARLGASCRLVARVGNDGFGRLCLNRLAADGVDTSRIAAVQGLSTGVAFVAYTGDGERSFIFHFGNAAAGALAPGDIHEADFEGVQIYHIMGCSLTAGEALREAVLKGARICKAMGARISFDPNLRPELLGISGARTAFEWVLQNTSILLAGAGELAALTGSGALEAAQGQRRRGAEIVVLKNGGEGARVLADGVDEVLPPYAVQQVDPTGAGDCFDGAFLAMLLAGKSPLAAGRVAAAAGAVAVTRQGPMEGAATPAEIEKLMGGGAV